MTTDVVTVPARATLRETIRQFLAEDVGTVVVVDSDGNPGGIVTETDALHAVYQAETAPEDIPVVKIAHSPGVTAKPTTPVGTIARKMADEAVQTVPVMDDLEFVGIVSQADIVRHISELRQERLSVGNSDSQWNS